jgi:hypothetical protein
MRSPLDGDVKLLFRTPTDIYDVIIRLRTDLMARHHQQVDAPKALAPLLGSEKPQKRWFKPERPEGQLLDFSPEERYFENLRSAFGEKAVLFYDSWGGHEIGVLWKPETLRPKTLCVRNMSGVLMSESATRDGDPTLASDIPGLVEDMGLMGGHLVDGFEVKNGDWAAASLPSKGLLPVKQRPPKTVDTPEIVALTLTEKKLKLKQKRDKKRENLQKSRKLKKALMKWKNKKESSSDKKGKSQKRGASKGGQKGFKRVKREG